MFNRGPRLGLSLLKIIGIIATSIVALSVHSEDFRTYKNRGVLEDDFDYDRTARLALALGRATESIPAERAPEIIEALNKKKAVPTDLSNSWQKLLRMAQVCTLMLENRYFFTHGYEFETLHPNHNARLDFKNGVKLFQKLIESSVGLNSMRVSEESAIFIDESKRAWSLVLESVRTWGYHDGYELVSPPLRTPEELESLAALIWRLGQSEFGQSNTYTGGHQTFSLVPVGEKADAQTIALVLTNTLLLQAQFGATIQELLDVRRNGGGAGNFFMRPIVLDHREFLNDLQSIGPRRLTLEKIHKLMFSTHIEKEFYVQVQNQVREEMMTSEERDESLNWPIEKKATFRPSWKYRDMRAKIDLEEAAKTLVEFRIGDYVADRPEQAVLETYIYQRLLAKAWLLAKEGVLWKLDIPARPEGVNDVEDWARLRLHPASSREALLQALDITDPNIADFILKRSFQVVNGKFKIARENVTGAFEIEGHSDNLVHLILPRDPALRARWTKMSKSQRVKAMKDMGFRFDGEFNWEKYRILTTEFYADTVRYPFLSPDLHLETSGNWEIKSNLRGFNDKDTLVRAIRQVTRHLPDEGFGLHIHKFIPQEVFDRLTPAKINEFVDYLERMSFYMLLVGYNEEEVEEAPHYLDSWSLDRYSPRDLEQVRQHLLGKIKLGPVEQKYHNIAFRPVEGGIDIEVRDLGDSVDYGIKIAEQIELALRTGNFGESQAVKDPALFMEFREHSEKESRCYTLADAVARAFRLTKSQEDLLRKFQFEIYKPSMKDYMYFEHFSTIEETLSADLDTAYIRTNFENNVVLPLLNYEEQSFLSAQDKTVLAQHRQKFIQDVYKLLLEVEKDPRYKFLKEHDNFLHLADWLKRSTHPSRPNFDLVSESVARKQRALLEDLVYRLRGLTITFVQKSKITKMVERSVLPQKPNTCVQALKRAG